MISFSIITHHAAGLNHIFQRIYKPCTYLCSNFRTNCCTFFTVWMSMIMFG